MKNQGIRRPNGRILRPYLLGSFLILKIFGGTTWVHNNLRGQGQAANMLVQTTNPRPNGDSKAEAERVEEKTTISWEDI